MAASDWIIIGRFGRPHGIKGFIKINSFTEPSDNILEFSPWYAFLDKQWQIVSLVEVEAHGKTLLAQVEGYTEREEIARLTNIDIAIKKKQLPKLGPGEYYWHQLLGMKVVNAQEIVLGHVKEMMTTGSNDVLVVEGEKRHLIPYLPEDIVLSIDETERLITVNWDEDF